MGACCTSEAPMPGSVKESHEQYASNLSSNRNVYVIEGNCLRRPSGSTQVLDEGPA